MQTQVQVQPPKGHTIYVTNLTAKAVTWFIKWNAHCASDNIPLSQKQDSKLGE